MTTPLGQRAVVVGGSMASLLTARVLADASAEVTVLDRDDLADLVVDAMGRGSRTPMWLEALGYKPAVEDRVRVDLGCASPCAAISSDTPSRDHAVSCARSRA